MLNFKFVIYFVTRSHFNYADNEISRKKAQAKCKA